MKTHYNYVAISITILSLILALPVQAGFWDKVKEQADKARGAIESLDDAASEAGRHMGLGNKNEEQKQQERQEQAGAPSPQPIRQASPPHPAQPTARAPQYDRSQVLAIQNRLNTLGYDVGTPDGIYGPGTRGGIESFQRDHNLAVDGKPSAALEMRLAREVETQTQPSSTASPISQHGTTAGQATPGSTPGSQQAVTSPPPETMETNTHVNIDMSSAHATFPDCETYFMVWARHGYEIDRHTPSYMPDHQPDHKDKYLRKSFLDKNFVPYFKKPFGNFSDAEIDQFQTHAEHCGDTVWAQKQMQRNTGGIPREEWKVYAHDWQRGAQWLQDNLRFRNRNIGFEQKGIHPEPILQQRTNYHKRQEALKTVENNRVTVQTLTPTPDSLRDIQNRRSNEILAYLYKTEYEAHQGFLVKQQTQLADAVIDQLTARLDNLPAGRNGIKMALSLRNTAQRDLKVLVSEEQWERFQRSFRFAFHEIARTALPGFSAELAAIPADDAGIRAANALMTEWFGSSADYPPNAGLYQQAASKRVEEIRKTMYLQACNSTLDSVGMLERRETPILGHQGQTSLADLLCNLDADRYSLVSYESGGFLSGKDILTLENRRGVDIKIILTMAEVKAGQQMLVGRAVENASSTRELTLEEWQDLYSQLVGKISGTINFGNGPLIRAGIE